MAVNYYSQSFENNQSFKTHIGDGRAQEPEGASDSLHGLPRADERTHERGERKVFFS
jgi:hypothetical protein